jgi:hypothetical protein
MQLAGQKAKVFSGTSAQNNEGGKLKHAAYLARDFGAALAKINSRNRP